MSGERNLYVYRLDITKPAGSDAPDWIPDDWEAISKRHGWYEPSFHWPTRRNYFSAEAAQRRAQLLREFGAGVAIMVGLVEWTGVWPEWLPVAAAGVSAAEETAEEATNG